MTEGEMLWYNGQGVYKDGFKVATFDTAELVSYCLVTVTLSLEKRKRSKINE